MANAAELHECCECFGNKFACTIRVQGAHEAKETDDFYEALCYLQTSALAESFEVNETASVFHENGDEAVVAGETNWETAREIDRPCGAYRLAIAEGAIVRLHWRLCFAMALACVAAADELGDMGVHVWP